MDEHEQIEAQAAALEGLTLRLSWSMRRRLAQQLDAFGLTMPQYMALKAIQRSPDGCGMGELAEATYQHSATMTGIIDRLAERGLVRRDRHPRDRRALVVALTEAGAALLGEVAAHKRAMMRALLAELSPDERQGVLAAVGRFLTVVEAQLAPDILVVGD
jgi:DNA-binding MarR family transcriptional regulator